MVLRYGSAVLLAYLVLGLLHAVAKAAPPISPTLQEQEEAVEWAAEVFDLEARAEQIKLAQGRLLDFELSRIEKTLGTDPDWTRKVRNSLNAALVETAKRQAKREGTTVFMSSASLDKELFGALCVRVLEDLPDSKISEFSDFRNEAIAYQQLKDEIGINGILVFLDNKLCLSQEQLVEIKSLFLESWDSTLNQVGAMASLDGLVIGEQIFDAISLEDWRKVLSKRQLIVFEGLDVASDVMTMLQMSSGSEDSEAKFKGMCGEAMQMKLNEYDRLLELTEDQRKVLTVARKGAISKASERLSELREEFLGGAAAMRPNFDLIFESMEPVINKCLKQPIWAKTLDSVFDDAERAVINRRESIRRQFAYEQMANCFVESLSSQSPRLELSREQHLELVEASLKDVDTQTTSFPTAIKTMFHVSDKEYEEILTADQWESLKPIVDQQRQAMKLEVEIETESDGR